MQEVNAFSLLARQRLVQSIVWPTPYPKLTHPAARFLCDSWATCLTAVCNNSNHLRCPSRSSTTTHLMEQIRLHVTACICSNNAFTTVVLNLSDRPQSDAVYNFGHVCMFRKRWRRSFIFARALSPLTTGWVRIWRSSGQGQVTWARKGRKFIFPQCKTSIGNNPRSIKHRAMMFAYSMGFSGTADRMM